MSKNGFRCRSLQKAAQKLHRRAAGSSQLAVNGITLFPILPKFYWIESLKIQKAETKAKYKKS